MKRNVVKKVSLICCIFMQHYFLLRDHPAGFAVAISYGFDHRPKLFGLKRIVTLWGAWDINF